MADINLPFLSESELDQLWYELCHPCITPKQSIMLKLDVSTSRANTSSTTAHHNQHHTHHTHEGLVSPMEFIIFLKTCEREFEEVSNEIQHMPKTELLKFNARQLSNLKVDGDEGARKREYEIKRHTRR